MTDYKPYPHTIRLTLCESDIRVLVKSLSLAKEVSAVLRKFCAGKDVSEVATILPSDVVRLIYDGRLRRIEINDPAFTKLSAALERLKDKQDEWDEKYYD